MTKYRITAVLQIEYQITVESGDESGALEVLNGWIDDDFKPHQTNAVWDFDVQEEEEETE